MNHILLVDDDPDFHRLLAYMLRSHDVTVDGVATLEEAREVADRARHSCILLDRDLAGTDGLALLPELSRLLPEAPVVLVTAHDSVDEVVRAMKAGTHDFIGKPVDEGRLVAALTKAAELHRLRREMSSLRGAPRDTSFHGLVGGSGPMQAVYEVIRNVARSDVNTLISGESGTGKELVARAVHETSGRRGPLVCLNMASLPADLVESTLFGHERGAFTGADKRRVGACEEAEGGTLFLDELTEMPFELQAKLLRFLQERAFRRVGGDRDLTSDVRIVSATNRDPLEEVDAGRFRLDLYYRLNVVPIRLPALRERPEDVPLLVDTFVRELSETHGKSFERVEDDAMARLARCTWPGNVRQLRHTIERIVVLNDGPALTGAMVPGDLERELHESGRDASSGLTTPTDDAPSATAPRVGGEVLPLSDLERQAIEHAVAVCPTIAEAARRLEISEATIFRRLKRYGSVTA